MSKQQLKTKEIDLLLSYLEDYEFESYCFILNTSNTKSLKFIPRLNKRQVCIKKIEKQLSDGTYYISVLKNDYGKYEILNVNKEQLFKILLEMPLLDFLFLKILFKDLTKTNGFSTFHIRMIKHLTDKNLFAFKYVNNLIKHGNIIKV
jgi:hypothetical protein